MCNDNWTNGWMIYRMEICLDQTFQNLFLLLCLISTICVLFYVVIENTIYIALYYCSLWLKNNIFAYVLYYLYCTLFGTQITIELSWIKYHTSDRKHVYSRWQSNNDWISFIKFHSIPNSDSRNYILYKPCFKHVHVIRSVHFCVAGKIRTHLLLFKLLHICRVVCI